MKHDTSIWKLLWGSLFFFQLLRFLIFYGLINIQWMNDKMLFWAILAVAADIYITKRLIEGFGLKPLYFSPRTNSRFINWNAIFAATISLFLPVIVLLLCDTPWRYVPDGPLQGPVSISDLDTGDLRGVIEFTDGRARHDYGWGIEVTASRYEQIIYADPFVTEQWNPTEPVKVWVIHSQFDELTPQHRFGYVVSWNYTQRSFWNYVVSETMEQHDLKSSEDMVLVTLNTRGPNFPHGPTLMQFILELYVFLGLYLGFNAYALCIPRPKKPGLDNNQTSTFK